MANPKRAIGFILFYLAGVAVFLSWNFRQASVQAQKRINQYLLWEDNADLKKQALEAEALRGQSKLKSLYDKKMMTQENYEERSLLIQRDYEGLLKENDEEKALFWRELSAAFNK